MSTRRQHDHDHGGADDGAFDWFRILDILVWVSVAVIAILAAEFLLGYLVRERIARGANKMLAKVNEAKAAKATPETDAGE